MRREFDGIFLDDTWLFILVSSCVGVILLGTLLAILLMKCKKTYHYPDSTTIKHPPVAAPPAGPPAKGAAIPGTMLYPFVPSAHYQSGLGADNRMLWATLTPHGTQHFISEPFVPQDDHYEVIDYHNRHYETSTELRKNAKNKNSFENSGFVDFDYEDPTPLMDSYNTDDIDSGYQEPQTINGSFNEGSLRAYVSTPTRIENPNMAPLNIHRGYESGTVGSRKSDKGTIGRRISDLSNGGKVKTLKV